MTTLTRVTEPGSNKPLRISDLIARLAAIQIEHGNLVCSIYSTDRRANVPLLDLCLMPGKVLSISAPTGTVVEEMCWDLMAEIERLRQQVASEGA